MKKLLLLSILIGILGCNSKIETNDSRQDVVQSGESYSYIVVRLEFISEIKQLCQDLLLETEFESEELYNQAVAQCTFEKLTILNINPTEITNFISTYCTGSPELTGMTPSEIANIEAACVALGVPRT